MAELVVWGLFDSGSGSYMQAAKNFKTIAHYSIGLDKTGASDHFISLDLASYDLEFSILKGKGEIIERLEQLPRPDLVIASPPCESWSIASGMKQGNACWKQEYEYYSRFTVRDYADFEGYQFNPEKSLLSRLNGELTVFNTVQIIKHFNPKYWIIENPAYGRLWDYIRDVLGFEIPYENLTYYSNYGYPLQKPTKFASNIDLKLDTTKRKGEQDWGSFSKDYNKRSEIPIKLVNTIFERVLEERK